MVPHLQCAAGQVLHAGAQCARHLGHGNTVGGHSERVQFHPNFIFPLSHDIDL